MFHVVVSVSGIISLVSRPSLKRLWPFILKMCAHFLLQHYIGVCNNLYRTIAIVCNTVYTKLCV